MQRGKVGAGAEGAIRAPKHGNSQVYISLELLKRRIKRLGSWPIHGILFIRTIQNNGADVTLFFDPDGRWVRAGVFFLLQLLFECANP